MENFVGKIHFDNEVKTYLIFTRALMSKRFSFSFTQISMKNVQKPNEFSGSQQMPNDPPTNEVHENESNDDYDNELYYDNVHQKYNDNNDINSNDVFNDNNDSKKIIIITIIMFLMIFIMILIVLIMIILNVRVIILRYSRFKIIIKIIMLTIM